jgi:hypothetical protein
VKVTTKRIEGHRTLVYSYEVNKDIGFTFHLLSEVGEPWQTEARELQQALLKPGQEVRQVELTGKPWYVDAIKEIRV